MAFIRDVEKQKRDEELRQGTNAPNAPTGGAPGAGGPAAPMSADKRSSGFTGIRKYLTANAGQGDTLSQRISSNVQKQAQGVQEDILNAGKQFKTAADASQESTFGAKDKPIIERYFSGSQYRGPETAESKRIKELTEAQYSGPGAINITELDERARKAQERASMLTSEEGRLGELQKTVQSPDYTKGQKRLDQLLLSTSPEAKSRLIATQQDVGQKLGTLPKTVAEQAAAEAKSRQGKVEELRQGLLKRLGVQKELDTKNTPTLGTVNPVLAPEVLAPVPNPPPAAPPQAQVPANFNNLPTLPGNLINPTAPITPGEAPTPVPVPVPRLVQQDVIGQIIQTAPSNLVPDNVEVRDENGRLLFRGSSTIINHIQRFGIKPVDFLKQYAEDKGVSPYIEDTPNLNPEQQAQQQKNNFIVQEQDRILKLADPSMVGLPDAEKAKVIDAIRKEVEKQIKETGQQITDLKQLPPTVRDIINQNLSDYQRKLGEEQLKKLQQQDILIESEQARLLEGITGDDFKYLNSEEQQSISNEIKKEITAQIRAGAPEGTVTEKLAKFIQENVVQLAIKRREFEKQVAQKSDVYRNALTEVAKARQIAQTNQKYVEEIQKLLDQHLNSPQNIFNKDEWNAKKQEIEAALGRAKGSFDTAAKKIEDAEAQRKAMFDDLTGFKPGIDTTGMTAKEFQTPHSYDKEQITAIQEAIAKLPQIDQQIVDAQKQLAHIGTDAWKAEQDAIRKKYGPTVLMITPEGQKAALQEQIKRLQQQKQDLTNQVGGITADEAKQYADALLAGDDAKLYELDQTLRHGPKALQNNPLDAFRMGILTSSTMNNLKPEEVEKLIKNGDQSAVNKVVSDQLQYVFDNFENMNYGDRAYFQKGLDSGMLKLENGKVVLTERGKIDLSKFQGGEPLTAEKMVQSLQTRMTEAKEQNDKDFAADVAYYSKGPSQIDNKAMWNIYFALQPNSYDVTNYQLMQNNSPNPLTDLFNRWGVKLSDYLVKQAPPSDDKLMYMVARPEEIQFFADIAKSAGVENKYVPPAGVQVGSYVTKPKLDLERLKSTILNKMDSTMGSSMVKYATGTSASTGGNAPKFGPQSKHLWELGHTVYNFNKDFRPDYAVYKRTADEIESFANQIISAAQKVSGQSLKSIRQILNERYGANTGAVSVAGDAAWNQLAKDKGQKYVDNLIKKYGRGLEKVKDLNKYPSDLNLYMSYRTGCFMQAAIQAVQAAQSMLSSSRSNVSKFNGGQTTIGNVVSKNLQASSKPTQGYVVPAPPSQTVPGSGGNTRIFF